MMNWDEVMEYEDDVREICGKLVPRIDPSLVEDVTHYVFMALTEVDPSQATGDKRQYIRGAIWNRVNLYFRDQKNNFHSVSLEQLDDYGVQIDESGSVLWPGHNSTYRGDFKDDG